MRDETPSGVLPDRVIRQLLKAAAAPGSPWMPPTTRPSGSSRTTKTSPSTSLSSPSLLLLLFLQQPPSARLLLPPFTSLSSSTPPPTMTARRHRALRPGRGRSRPILLVLSTTTSIPAATLARTCPTRHTQTEMAVAATNSVLSRLRRPQALHRQYLPRASTSLASPWAPTTSLPSSTSTSIPVCPASLPADKRPRMINDPKSQHFISWTELGASFVVSNVGEFSRSILGSHFKHNNVRLPLFPSFFPPTDVSPSSQASYDNSTCTASTKSTGSIIPTRYPPVLTNCYAT